MKITQPSGHGASTSRRYGSFEGRSTRRDVDLITQAYGFGAHSGRRYGSFAGRTTVSPPAPTTEGAAGKPLMASDLANLRRIYDDDDLLLLHLALLFTKRADS